MQLVLLVNVVSFYQESKISYFISRILGRKRPSDAHKCLANTGIFLKFLRIFEKLISEMERFSTKMEPGGLWWDKTASGGSRQDMAPGYCTV